jgi:hypothetical protein
MADKPFWITSFKSELDVANRLAAAGENSRSANDILRRLSALAAFLDHNQLSTHKLTNADGLIGEDFVLESSDLSPLGLKLIKGAYVKWQRQAKTPDDMKPLEKALIELRRTN